MYSKLLSMHLESSIMQDHTGVLQNPELIPGPKLGWGRQTPKLCSTSSGKQGYASVKIKPQNYAGTAVWLCQKYARHLHVELVMRRSECYDCSVFQPIRNDSVKSYLQKKWSMLKPSLWNLWRASKKHPFTPELQQNSQHTLEIVLMNMDPINHEHGCAIRRWPTQGRQLSECGYWFVK